MKNLVIVLVVLVVVAGLLAGPLVSSYNKLVPMNEEINAAWAQINTQLQRRYDLIPNLVNTVKGYAAHETAVFTAVSEARAKLAGSMSPTTSIEARSAAEQQMSGALSRLIAIAEAYPELKADTQFRALMDELTGTENRIATARLRYNQTVQNYNQTLKQFPMVIFGKMLGFSEKPYFQSQPGAQDAPKVNF
jgi:LemA protein